MIIIKNDRIKKEFLEYYENIKFTRNIDFFKEFIPKNHNIEHVYSEYDQENIITGPIQPFVFAVHLAYCYHVPLVISPNIIWHIICSSFNNFNKTSLNDINKKIILNFNKQNDWDQIIEKLLEKIKNNCNLEIFNKIKINFSTSNQISLILNDFIQMPLITNSYNFSVKSLCGIPEIHIDGTKNDWIMLKKRSFELINIVPKLNYWMKSLNEILDNFINAFENKIDIEFWNNIYKQNKESGGPYITGWIIAFFPNLNYSVENIYLFTDKLTWRNSLDKNCSLGLTSDLFNLSLNFVAFEDIENKKFNFFSGIIGTYYDDKDSKLIPIFGYAFSSE